MDNTHFNESSTCARHKVEFFVDYIYIFTLQSAISHILKVIFHIFDIKTLVQLINTANVQWNKYDTFQLFSTMGIKSSIADTGTTDICI